jgi:hypothetical protein
MDHDRPSASVRMLPSATGLVLFDTSKNCVWAYNDSARQVWDCIEQGCSEHEFVADLAGQYGIPEDVARRDVGAILNEWRVNGLISVDARHSPAAAPTKVIAAGDWAQASEPRWAETFTCTIQGKVFALAIEPTEPATLLRFMFQHLETPGASPDVRLEVRDAGAGMGAVLVNGIERLRTADGGVVVGAIDQTILENLHPEIGWLAMVHGGAFSRGNAGFAVPGICGSGKTTLIAYLIAQKSYTYIADDLIALAAPDGRIVPWPMPLNPKQGSWDLLCEFYPDLSNSPKRRTTRGDARRILPRPDAWDADPVTLRGFIFPRYVAGAEAKLTRLTPFEALERLLKDRVWLGYPLTEQRVRNFIAWLDDKPAYALVHGNVAVAAELLEDLA